MDTRKVWFENPDPVMQKKFDQFLNYLRLSHDGNMDMDAFLDSAYGAEFTRRLQVRFRYEDDAMGEAALAYYCSIGLKKEMHDAEDYYSRWVIFTPLTALRPENAAKKYPLVISQHGGGSSIETDEFSTGFTEIAAKEEFFLLIAQNTNWDSINSILNRVLENYPVDPGRVYMSGLSQGGSQTNTCLFRMPHRFAAVAPNSCDFIRTSDNFDIPFTPEEFQRVTDTVVPVLYTTGANDASYYVPLNQWQPRKGWGGKLGDPETYKPAERDNEKDPTWIHDPTKGYRDAARKKMEREPNWWMCHPMRPGEDEDPRIWAINRVNLRLKTLGCKEVDMVRCLAYTDPQTDTFHHLLGIYGDKESIEEYTGCKHYILNNFNSEGINTFRMVVVENFPHWQSVHMAQLCWDFFRRFRRTEDGKLIQTEK